MPTRSLEEWVVKSHRVFGLEENPFIQYDFQALGKLEHQLSQDWGKMRNNLRDSTNMRAAFDNHSILSRLWVIAGYEFLRQQVRKYDKRSEVKKAHKLFERVRIPMVKYDVPNDYYTKKPIYTNDFGTAILALGQETQEIGWAVAPDMFISREELANALYNLY